MLAPGSSACYCAALAEKRQRKCLRMAEEEEEEEEAAGGGDTAQAVFPIYQQGGGYTNNSACFPTHVHANLPPALPYSLFSALSHTLSCSLTQYISVIHSICLSFSLPPFSVCLCFLCLPLLNNPSSLSLPFLCCAVSPPLALSLSSPWLDLPPALSHLAPSVAVRCRGSPSILGRLFVCVAAAVTTLAVLRMSPMVCLTDVHPPGTTLSPITV